MQSQKAEAVTWKVGSNWLFFWLYTTEQTTTWYYHDYGRLGENGCVMNWHDHIACRCGYIASVTWLCARNAVARQGASWWLIAVVIFLERMVLEGSFPQSNIEKGSTYVPAAMHNTIMYCAFLIYLDTRYVCLYYYVERIYQDSLHFNQQETLCNIGQCFMP